MAATVRAVGANASGTTSATPGLPTGTVDGDLLICIAASSGSATEPTMTGDWTKIRTVKNGTALTDSMLTVWWHTGSSTTVSRLISSTVNHVSARIIGITSGTFSITSPIDAESGGNVQASTTSVSISGLTTSKADCLILSIAGASLPDANSTAQFSAWTNASLTPTSLTEQTDNNINTGNGGGHGSASSIKTTAGVVSATTATKASAALMANLMIAIGPTDPVIYDRNISFSLDSQIVVDSPPPANIYDESVTLTSDHLIDIIASLSYESSTTLSSNHDITVQNDLVAENTITFTSNNTIDVASDATLESSVSISSDNTLTAQGNLDVDNSVQLDSNSTIDVTGGLDVHDSTTLTADSEVDVNGDLVIDQSITLTTDNDVDVQSNLDASGDVTLTGDGEVDVSGDLTIDTSITLQNNNTIDVAGNLDVTNSVSLDSDSSLEVDVSNDVNGNVSLNTDNTIATNSNLDAVGDVTLQTDNTIDVLADVSLDGIVTLESDTDIDILTNLDASGNVSLESDGGFNDQSLADYLNSSVLLSDGTIELTTEQIAELTLALLAAAQLSVDADNDGFFEAISIQMNNEILFDIFIEAYNQLSLLSEATTTFDVVSIIDSVLSLNINTEILVEISNTLDSAITLSTTNTIQTEGDVVSPGNIYNESIVLIININLDFIDSIGGFMKIIGALFVKNINKIIG